MVLGSLLLFSITANCQVYKCNEAGRIVYSDINCSDSNILSDASRGDTVSLREGLAAYTRRDFETAYAKLVPHAEHGVAIAQNTLGRMYLQGDGVAKNTNRALELFRKAASSGLAAALNNLGVMYMAGEAVKRDYAKALSYFRSAANQGFSPAMLNLAEMYSEGFGVLRDTVEASRWKARATGIVSSSPHDEITIQFPGGEQYTDGMHRYYRGDYHGAAKLLLISAELGHPEAQLRLSLMCREGQGLPKDTNKGNYWELKAKENGRQMNDGRDRVIVNLYPPGDPRLIPPSPPKPVRLPSQGACIPCRGTTSYAQAVSSVASSVSNCKCD